MEEDDFILPAVSFAALKPHLFVEAPKANVAVAFYKNVLGAGEVSRTLNPKRKADQEIHHVLSAELKIAGSLFLVVNTVDDSATPVKSGGNSVAFALETEDVEGAIAKAVKGGAVVDIEGAIAKAVKGGAVVDIEGASGEGRVRKVTDPYGYVWQISAYLKKRCWDLGLSNPFAFVKDGWIRVQPDPVRPIVFFLKFFYKPFFYKPGLASFSF
ncbi:unnamed protein product [Vicia faba]|uniref:VOC domain-containing protein n=1 Tax=Vicia faba TaxID=3906 RepID=A0AAV0YUQ1_VICFA|nr:unnamed protein product [Vicia faba]